MRLALATCHAARGLDEDEPELIGALAARGVRAEPVAWDEAADWAAYAVVAVRSTWDYPARRDAFLAWARRVDRVSRLVNPPGMVAWTTDKAYLAGLAAAGLPVVPTRPLGPDGTGPLPDGEYVVKPRVGAGAVDALRLGPGREDEARALARRLHDEGRGALVQPYLAGVDHAGETALVYLGGALSHAIGKGPLLHAGAPAHAGLFAAEDITPRTPAAGERAVGDAVLAHLARAFGRVPAYARVDLVPGPGGPLVLEVELAEPSLFLAHGPGAAGRLADALIRA